MRYFSLFLAVLLCNVSSLFGGISCSNEKVTIQAGSTVIEIKEKECSIAGKVFTLSDIIQWPHRIDALEVRIVQLEYALLIIFCFIMYEKYFKDDTDKDSLKKNN